MDLSEAFRLKDSKALIALLKSGCDVQPDPEELLLKAAHYGNEEVLQAALEAGIHPDSHGALAWACGSGKLGPIKKLIAAGADVNRKSELGSTPVTKAAGAGKVDQLKLLIKHGAKLDGALLAA